MEYRSMWEHNHDRVGNVLHVSWPYASEQKIIKENTFMLMSPSYKQYVHKQELLILMILMHILTLWSWVGLGWNEPAQTRLDNTGTSTSQSKQKKPQEYQDWDDMYRVSTRYHIGFNMSPRIKICNEFDWFLSLRCLAPPESYMGYWEKIGNKKSELKDTNG